MVDYILLFLLWLISTILVRAIFKTRTASKLPPSPLALPLIGHLHLLAPLPHQALHKLSTRHGPLFHILLGSVPCVVASSAETAKEFLKTHESSFSNRPKMAAVDYLTYGSQDFSFAPYGPYWKFLKNLCMSELLGGKTLNSFLPVRHHETIRFIELLAKKAENGEKVDVGGELVKVTNNIVSRMLMNVRCSENEAEAGDVRKLISETAELTGKFNVSDFIWGFKNLDIQGFGKRLKDVRDRFDKMMDRIIEGHKVAMRKRKEIGDGDYVKDLLDILLEISDDEKSEIRLSMENIKAFILDIFAAGTDTSATTIEWALAELINHPNFMHNAIQEIDCVVGKSRLVEESDIPNLPYLQAIVKETLRLHPSPLIVRESTEDCTISGYHIPAKTRLFINIWGIGRDPNHWPEPLEFRPERFLGGEGSGGKSNNLDVRGQHFQYLPFGSGRRGCPGTTLAMQVVQTGLAVMVQCFEWKVNGPVSMEEGTGLTLPRAHPLLCVPVARLNPIPSM